MTNQGHSSQGISLCIIWSSIMVQSLFYCGYKPASIDMADGKKVIGTIPKAENRKIIGPEGQSSALLYNKWTGNLLEDYIMKSGNILAASTLFPLGRFVGYNIDENPCYQILHPASITDKQEITLFADVNEGDRIELMRGTEENLVNEISAVCRRNMLNAGITPADVKGVLIVYCAGCLMASKSHIDRVIKRMNNVLGNVPFIGTFNFGEQVDIQRGSRSWKSHV
jgi:hypothetical protein